MHQRLDVIDERMVILGSLNSLSPSRSREFMLTIRGGHFARAGPQFAQPTVELSRREPKPSSLRDRFWCLTVPDVQCDAKS